MLSNCGHDERGRYRGGRAGDQTGGEWALVPWYNRLWDYMLRWPTWEIRNMIADFAVAAAYNNNIGYNQDDRLSFWRELVRSGYRPGDITVPCNADCSSGVAAICKAVGVLVDSKRLQRIPATAYTGNILSYMRDAGFIIYTDRAHLIGPDRLTRGDILLYRGHHIATNVDFGRLTYLSQGWITDSNGTWYAYGPEQGMYYRGGMHVIDGKTYQFDDNGYVVR